MSAPANAREARLARRFDEPTSNDPQLVAAQARPLDHRRHRRPRPAPHRRDPHRDDRLRRPPRPRPARRRVRHRRIRPHHRRTAAPLRHHTYRETWNRVRALADALAGNPVQPGDRVATLGFTSADYAIVDMALSLTGAVAVPLQTSAPVQQLHPILVETEPVAILSSVDHLDDAVELALTAYTPKRLVVFDYHPQVDDQREAFESAARTPGRAARRVESLDDVIARRAQHSDGPEIHPATR